MVRAKVPGLGRLVDEFVGDPSCDVFGIWGGQAEDDVLEACVDGFSDRIPDGVGMVVRDWQGDGSGDRGGSAADLGTDAVQESTSTDDIIDVAAGDVPQVGMLGNHPQRRARASADQYRRMRSLGGFGVAERSAEVEVGAVEVERFGLGPQPSDDHARFGKAPNRVGEVVVGQSVCLVLTPG